MNTQLAFVALTFALSFQRMVAADFSATNSTFISIPAFGRANPYPSTITVSNTVGVMGKVTATLFDFLHKAVTDVNVLLVNPDESRAVVLMSAAGCTGVGGAETLTFDDETTGYITCSFARPALTSGVYRATGVIPPGEFGHFGPFPPETPLDRYSTNLSGFAGTNPNGVWSLYVWDDESEDGGRIGGGWSLAIALTFPLAIQRSPTNVVISWPATATNFVLQAASSLSASSQWEIITNRMDAFSERFSVSLPLDQPRSFFRLRRSLP